MHPNEPQNIPNLDAMNAEDLAQIVVEPNLPDGAPCGVRDLFQRYAFRKMVAMDERASGSIEYALCHERQCDALYARIPDEWQW